MSFGSKRILSTASNSVAQGEGTLDAGDLQAERERTVEAAPRVVGVFVLERSLAGNPVTLEKACRADMVR
jgi:hypothetical protein